MSDRQETSDEVSSDHRPDGAIETAAEDKLERGAFVTRLAHALVTPAGRASGLAIGLTGPWGSGKTSILNLLEAEIKKTHSGAVVVRFDPWLVSGRDDVITQFFAELLTTIKEVTGQKGRDWKKIKGTVHKLSGYAKDLAPAAGLLSLVPAIGVAAAGTATAVGAAAKTMEAATAARTTSLATQHKELRALLTGVAMPIVVLIDELDRVEDAEVRAVAQLVRAVANFPGISYLLAYDQGRVVEALGGGSRGAAYLEKIVQLEIPLPVLARSEAKHLFLTEFEKVAALAELPVGWRQCERFERLLDVSVPKLLSTPRDIGRVCSSYAVLYPMVAGEVDWADVLGYAMLRTKAPSALKRIWQSADLLVEEGDSEQAGGSDLASRKPTAQVKPEEALAAIQVKSDDPEVEVLQFLFPRLGDHFAHRWGYRPDRLRYRRPFTTLMRLGLVSGDVSRAEVSRTLALSYESMIEDLRTRYAKGRMRAFIDRWLSVAPDMDVLDPARTVTAMATLVREARHCRGSASDWRDLNTQLLRVLDLSVKEDAKWSGAVVHGLEESIGVGCFDFPALILNRHIKIHKLYGYSRGLEVTPLFDQEVTERLVKSCATTVRMSLLDGRLLANLATVQPLLLLRTVLGNGELMLDQECRDSLERQIREDVQIPGQFLQLMGTLEILDSFDGILEPGLLDRLVREQRGAS